MSLAPGAYYLVGPTASGKTACAQRIAEGAGADILSADSMLVYRGMDIGTAKPSAAERARVRYGGLDLVDPAEPCSAALWLGAARAFAAQARAANRPLLVAGGTGLYFAALTRGLDAAGPAPDPAVRARWQAVFEREGVDGLRAALAARGLETPLSAADRSNPRRLIRTLERAEAYARACGRETAAMASADRALTRAATGATADTSWARAAAGSPVFIGLAWPRAALIARIAARVAAMFDGGLPEEVERLRAAGLDGAPTARQAIGYAEAADLLDGRLDRDGARARAVIRTRQLAKRQMTWFRHQAHVTWIEAADGESTESLAGRVTAAWLRLGPAPWPVAGG